MKHKPLPVSLEEADVVAIDSFPYARHAVMIACIRAGLAMLPEQPERVLEFNPRCMTKMSKG
jgi:hypothetical protein